MSRLQNNNPQQEQNGSELTKAFQFKQCISILKATGKKARNLRELRETISTVTEDSIFHHIYQYFLKEHIHEYTNDFAHWAGESLEERALAEHLSNIDPYNFSSIADLRKKLINVIDDYLRNFPEPREAMPGSEFYFNETITLTFPVGIRARNLAEFLIGIKYIEKGSIFFHFYDARMRLRSGVDDFSSWIQDVIGNRVLAEKIRAIDPFMHDIEGIREHIIEVIDEAVRRQMEAIQK